MPTLIRTFEMPTRTESLTLVFDDDVKLCDFQDAVNENKPDDAHLIFLSYGSLFENITDTFENRDDDNFYMVTNLELLQVRKIFEALPYVTEVTDVTEVTYASRASHPTHMPLGGDSHNANDSDENIFEEGDSRVPGNRNRP